MNLLRWFDFVQNVIGAKEIFGRVTLPLQAYSAALCVIGANHRAFPSQGGGVNREEGLRSAAAAGGESRLSAPFASHLWVQTGLNSMLPSTAHPLLSF